MSGLGASFELTNASVAFGSLHALQDITLSVGAGEAVAVVGPSGAGKSTLLRLCNGTLRPTQGRVTVDGVDLRKLAGRPLRALRARIGFVHQDLSLVPNLRVLQNVLAGRLGQWSVFGGMRALLLPRRRDVAQAYETLERVGIGEKLYARTDQLSGGQQQRVAIARALFQQPAALLADEPVSSVDPARARDTIELLTQVSREQQLTLIVSIHNVALARAHFPRLVGLRAGRVMWDIPTSDVTDTQLERLYNLSREEMLADGA